MATLDAAGSYKETEHIEPCPSRSELDRNDKLKGQGGIHDAQEILSSNVELTESDLELKELKGLGDIREAQELKVALSLTNPGERSESQATTSGQAATSCLGTAIDWDFVSGIVDSLGGSLTSEWYTRFSKLFIPSANILAILNMQLVLFTLVIRGEEVGILYWNEEFCTICKYNGAIYMLTEDENLHRSHPNAVWKTLNTVNQKEVFVTSTFVPISAFPWTKDALATYWDKFHPKMLKVFYPVVMLL